MWYNTGIVHARLMFKFLPLAFSLEVLESRWMVTLLSPPTHSHILTLHLALFLSSSFLLFVVLIWSFTDVCSHTLSLHSSELRATTFVGHSYIHILSCPISFLHSSYTSLIPPHWISLFHWLISLYILLYRINISLLQICHCNFPHILFTSLCSPFTKFLNLILIAL